MSNISAVLVQYQVFAERRLHYGRMFWANIAFLIVVLIVVLALALRQQGFELSWIMLGSGAATVQMSYIAHRLKRLEDQYEQLMHDLEVAMQAAGEKDIIVAPRSSRLSARTMTVLSLVAMGAGLMGFGLVILYVQTLSL